MELLISLLIIVIGFCVSYFLIRRDIRERSRRQAAMTEKEKMDDWLNHQW